MSTATRTENDPLVDPARGGAEALNDIFRRIGSNEREVRAVLFG